jgi:hypothetical protein
VSDRAGDLADRAQSAAKDLVDRAGQYAGQGKDAVRHLADEASDAGHKAKEWAGDAYDVSAEKLDVYTQELASVVRKYPVQAVLVGFLAGSRAASVLRETRAASFPK